MKSTIVVVLSLSICGACNADSPKDASKENFKQVINGYFDRNCVFVYPRYTNYPVTLELPPENPTALDMARDKTKTYEALTKIGMFNTQDGTEEKINLMSFGNDNKTYTVKTRTYSLSEQGKAAAVKQTNSWSGSETGFCAATLEVNEIKNYSEPSERMGMTVSKVNFTASPKKIESWANTEEVLNAFPRLAKKLLENKDESVGLVLMSDGWFHEKEM